MLLDRGHKWVVPFEEGSDSAKHILGSKGAGLSEMTKLGLPVPPGFIITTEACKQLGEYPHSEVIWQQAEEALQKIEAKTGKRFGELVSPLLVSVRSGASVSMPGMMDTILNIGLNEEVAGVLAVQSGNYEFALNTFNRFLSAVSEIVCGAEREKIARNKKPLDDDINSSQIKSEFSNLLRHAIDSYMMNVLPNKCLDILQKGPKEQLHIAVKAVADSWMNPRAVEYRRRNSIPHHLGTAVIVQAMAFGNLGPNSGTGVVFTRNPLSGKKELYGEYLFNAQGVDLVAGLRTPKSISYLHEEFPTIYDKLIEVSNVLERHYRDMQEVEFTVEQGYLWILQTRTGRCTPAARINIATDMCREVG